MSSRRLQDVFSVTIFRLPRRPQDVLREVWKTSSRRLQDVLEDVKLLSWRRFEDVFKTSWRPTNVCWESIYKINLFHGKYIEAAITMCCNFQRIISSYLNFSKKGTVILEKRLWPSSNLSSKVEDFKLSTLKVLIFDYF